MNQNQTFSVLKQLWGFLRVSETCGFPHIQREFPLQSSSSAWHCHHQWPQEDSRHDPTENPQQSAQLQCCLVMGSKMLVWSTANQKGSASAHWRLNFPFFTPLATKHRGSGTWGESLQRRPLPRREFHANRHKIITLHTVTCTWSSKTLSVKPHISMVATQAWKKHWNLRVSLSYYKLSNINPFWLKMSLLGGKMGK